MDAAVEADAEWMHLFFARGLEKPFCGEGIEQIDNGGERLIGGCCEELDAHKVGFGAGVRVAACAVELPGEVALNIANAAG